MKNLFLILFSLLLLVGFTSCQKETKFINENFVGEYNTVESYYLETNSPLVSDPCYQYKVIITDIDDDGIIKIQLENQESPEIPLFCYAKCEKVHERWADAYLGGVEFKVITDDTNYPYDIWGYEIIGGSIYKHKDDDDKLRVYISYKTSEFMTDDKSISLLEYEQ